MAGSLEPQDCYSANALMQLGGRDLGDGQTAPNSQANAALNVLAVNTQNGVNMDQSVSQIGGQVSNGITWPLNIFDIGQNGPSS